MHEPFGSTQPSSYNCTPGHGVLSRGYSSPNAHKCVVGGLSGRAILLSALHELQPTPGMRRPHGDIALFINIPRLLQNGPSRSTAQRGVARPPAAWPSHPSRRPWSSPVPSQSQRVQSAAYGPIGCGVRIAPLTCYTPVRGGFSSVGIWVRPGNKEGRSFPVPQALSLLPTHHLTILPPNDSPVRRATEHFGRPHRCLGAAAICNSGFTLRTAQPPDSRRTVYS
jgi:hypothetical protein